MKVIFTQDDGVALVDDIKNVKPGYARYLFRYDKAQNATPELIEKAKKREAEKLKKLEEVKKEAEKVVKKLEGTVLEFKENADGVNLYGSVTEKDIVEKMAEIAKIEITKDQVHMGDHLKKLGQYEVKIQLAPKVELIVTVNVMDEEGNMPKVEEEVPVIPDESERSEDDDPGSKKTKKKEKEVAEEVKEEEKKD